MIHFKHIKRSLNVFVILHISLELSEKVNQNITDPLFDHITNTFKTPSQYRTRYVQYHKQVIEHTLKSLQS